MKILHDKISNRIQIAASSAFILLSISHWFPLGIGPLELLNAFAHFTVILSAVTILLSLTLKFRFLAVSALISLCISGALVLPHFTSLESSEESDFTIGQFNMYHNNPSPERAIWELAQTAPDIFSIQEQNITWSPIIDSLFRSTHPYTIEAPWTECCYGIGLYSKYPIVSYNVIDLDNTPVIIAQFLFGTQELTVISLHTRPPAFPNETEKRNRQLETVADIISHESGPCLVIGDFNIVPWDEIFKEFLKVADLSAIRDGFQATYPMDFGFPLIPIDHITHSDNLIPKSCKAVIIPGSDHRGLIAGFKFKD